MTKTIFKVRHPKWNDSCGVLAFQPCLEHQHIPQLRIPVTPAAEMLEPALANRCRAQESAAPQCSLAQQVFRPLAQRSAQPCIHWHGESCFWPLDEMARHVPIKNLAQDPLGLSVTQLE